MYYNERKLLQKEPEMKEETKLMIAMSPIWIVNLVGDKVYRTKKKVERRGRDVRRKLKNSFLYR